MADRVTVIGWDGSPLTAAARSALGAATLVAGAAHHLALPEVPPTAERIRLGSVALAARRLAAHRGTTVVLADGDPGFFGVVRTLRAPEFGLEVEVVPAVSSVAAAFARAGLYDAHAAVAHPRTLRRAVNVCRAHSKVAVLTSPGAGPAELGLLMEGVHRTFVICEELGTTRERVTVVTSDKAADHTWRDPNVVIVAGGSTGPAVEGDGTGWIAGRAPADGPRGWSLPAAATAANWARASSHLPHRPTGPARTAPRRSRVGHRLRQRRLRHRSRARRRRRHRGGPAAGTGRPARAPRPRHGTSASSSRPCTATHRTSWRTFPNRTSSGSAAGSGRGTRTASPRRSSPSRDRPRKPIRRRRPRRQRLRSPLRALSPSWTPRHRWNSASSTDIRSRSRSRKRP
ncbi:hypothetical protein SALBM217S_09931 [Streptomyces griseoloalbus]